MNSHPSPDSVIDEQAATWAARLDGGSLDARDRATLDAWLAESQENRAALSAYCQFSTDLEEQLPQLVASGAVKMPATAAHRSQWNWTFPRVASAAFAMAAAATFGIWLFRPAPQVENVVTAIAQRSSSLLSDGTRVELNAHTSLSFKNRKDERRARLAGGEAIFTVAKDPSRPFIVETPNGAVRVTGTTFNIRISPNGTAFEVTVVEGSVQVRPINLQSDRADEGPFALTALDQLSAGPDGVAVKSIPISGLEDTLAWRRGQVVFAGVPLREAADRFAHYHGSRIVVSPVIANESVGGQYSLDDLDGFLRGMETALAIDLRTDGNGTAYLSPRHR